MDQEDSDQVGGSMALPRIEERRDLTEFLRTRRARLSPAEVGLPSGSRRRAPGLRREHIAQLAGVGITWYTWFEQGRDIQVSTHFLENLATALRLDDAERAHLFALAQHRLPPLGPVQAAPGAGQFLVRDHVPLRTQLRDYLTSARRTPIL